MNEPTSGAKTSVQKSDTTPGLLGVACGIGAALFWALGFVATRHGLKAGFTPVDLLMHRFLWSGLVFLPFVFRAGLRDLCGIGWGRGMALMVLGGPVMSLISYAGFLFVPLGHGSVIQPSCATLGGLLFAAFLLHERIAPSRIVGALVIVAGLGVIGSESIAHIGLDGVRGDLIFVLTGMMFAGFGTLVSPSSSACCRCCCSRPMRYRADWVASRRSVFTRMHCRRWRKASCPGQRRCICSPPRSSILAPPVPRFSRRQCRH